MKRKTHNGEEAVEMIKELTRHKHARLVHRGNAAIFTALCIAKKMNPKPFILIPDQGGWISFQTYPRILGFDIRKVKTNRGLIDLIDLEKKAESGAAFLATSFAGYFAEQPMKYISRICKKNNCLLIEDASGALGDDELCDGHYSDIIAGSFGRWKPINVGYGGFISTSGDWFEKANEAFSMTNHYPVYDELVERLHGAKERIKKMIELSNTVKKELSDEKQLKIVHQDLRGLNVMVLTPDEKAKEEAEEYCKRKGYEYVQCPNYTRLDEAAISIELKRIDPGVQKR